MVVNSEMDHAAPELEQQLTRITVFFILLYSVFHSLFCEAVFELEGGYWQAVYEKAEVECKLCFVPAVAELPCDAEAVQRIAFFCFCVSRCWRAVKEVNVVFSVFYAVPQHFDYPALCNLPLQAGEELLAGGAGIFEVKGFSDPRLCGFEEFGELDEVNSVFAVVVLPAPSIQPVPP
jgi:hypothetical protein